MIIPKQVRKFSKQKNCSSKQCQDNIELNLAWVIYSVKHKEIPIVWLMMHSSLPYSKEAKMAIICAENVKFVIHFSILL